MQRSQSLPLQPFAQPGPSSTTPSRKRRSVDRSSDDTDTNHDQHKAQETPKLSTRDRRKLAARKARSKKKELYENLDRENSRLQEELHEARSQVQQLQAQLDAAVGRRMLPAGNETFELVNAMSLPGLENDDLPLLSESQDRPPVLALRSFSADDALDMPALSLKAPATWSAHQPPNTITSGLPPLPRPTPSHTLADPRALGIAEVMPFP